VHTCAQERLLEADGAVVVELEVWDRRDRKWMPFAEAAEAAPGGMSNYYFQSLRGSASLVADNITLFVPPNAVQDGSSALNWESNRIVFERSGHTVKGGLWVRDAAPRSLSSIARSSLV
jgi:hypothetical protein